MLSSDLTENYLHHNYKEKLEILAFHRMARTT